MYTIFVINPGSTSTKLALFENESPVWQSNIPYLHDRLAPFKSAMEQLEMRRSDIIKVLEEKNTDVRSLSAVVSRGGPFKPLESGTFRIHPQLLSDIQAGRIQAEHISNIGVFLADRFVRNTDVPAFFVDPVSVDEFESVARLSGMPEIERRSLVHALNIRAVARKAADRLGRSFSDLNFVIAHLGGGISICPLKRGRIVDANNAVEEGPFSPERSGALPASSLVALCYSGKFTVAEMKKKIVGLGGLIAYLGTNDARIVERRIAEGDSRAELVYRAMAYQISKEIGAMAAVLSGEIDGVVLTGGLAHSKLLTEWINERVSFFGPVFIFPGEIEMEALALGVLRVLRGEEKSKSYINNR